MPLFNRSCWISKEAPRQKWIGRTSNIFFLRGAARWTAA
jgi:hypothetical protein